MRDAKKRTARRALQVFLSSFFAVAIIGLFVYVTKGRDLPVLNPQGTIADQQLILILITIGLGVFVVIPVFILLFFIAWRYREGNKKAKYDPELEGHRGLELLWWGIPCLIILALAIITVVSTRALDPYKELESNVKPVKVQVIALEWRWLFIYPDYNVATLNYLNIPKDTPINFEITSDAPMNSFWVPALAGQVYAMSGMRTKLHAMADTTGTFRGSSANISGDGYANMTFNVYSMNEADFATWTTKTMALPNLLTSDSYKEIARKSKDKTEQTYAVQAGSIFDEVIMKYMGTE